MDAFKQIQSNKAGQTPTTGEELCEAFNENFSTIRDSFVKYEVTPSLQEGDFSVTIVHNKNSPTINAQLEDEEGFLIQGILIQNIYVDDLCNQTKIHFSETIDKNYILKLIIF